MFDPNRLRICFIAGTLGRGGAERQLVFMLSALNRAGISTRVLCLTNGEPLESDIKSIGVRVDWVGSSKWRSLRLCQIIRSLRHEPADILQSAHFYTNLYAATAARVARIKSIGAIRCDLFSELLDNGFAGRWDLHMPHHLISNSRVAQEHALALGIPPAKIDVVSNVVGWRGQAERVTRNGQGTVRILFVGRLCSQKRPDRFLRMISRVAQGAPGKSVKGIIVGDGPLMSDLPKLALAAGVSADQLEVLGEQANLDEIYNQADILALTSDYEGSPNVLLEAMALGLPTVATRVGGVPELIGKDRGFTVDTEDEKGLADCVLKLIENSTLRIMFSNRAREYVSQNHSIDSLQDQLSNIYLKIFTQK